MEPLRAVATRNLLIHNLSAHFPSVSLSLLAMPRWWCSIIFTRTHTVEPEKISFMHQRKAEGMFFFGVVRKKTNIFPIPNDEWRFRSINENAPTEVD